MYKPQEFKAGDKVEHLGSMYTNRILGMVEFIKTHPKGTVVATVRDAKGNTHHISTFALRLDK